MDTKLKIITILARLWFTLGVIFTINFLFLIGFFIYAILTSSSKYSFLFIVCSIWLLILIFVLLFFSVLSFVQWDSISKFKKWAVKRSLPISFIFLLFWLGPVLYFVSETSFYPLSFWDIFLVSMCSILIVDIVILVVSLSPAVKEFLK
ncbi:hypothetical protein AYK24_06880 [Thermoplasmatales archaeon SG8-52-4]|nr:MAG: hypothetical protein AYK24_06880 [Thermoplasmatales archaeon SG8-52-4]